MKEITAYQHAVRMGFVGSEPEFNGFISDIRLVNDLREQPVRMSFAKDAPPELLKWVPGRPTSNFITVPM